MAVSFEISTSSELGHVAVSLFSIKHHMIESVESKYAKRAREEGFLCFCLVYISKRQRRGEREEG